MWQLLLKILKFVNWQYNASLKKRGPNSAPLRRYKSWNTFLESGELVQICTLWEQKLTHKVKECNSAGNPALIFFTWVALLPTGFTTLLLFWYWQAQNFMWRWLPSPFHPYLLPWPFYSRGVAWPETGDICTQAQCSVVVLMERHSTHRQKAQ